VADETARSIQAEVEACYRALAVPLPASVSLCLFDTLERWRGFAARQRAEAGVVTAGDEGFLATHDAWAGEPRLGVCLERLQVQPRLLQQGALHQVVAHSVLHGRPDYYRFTIPGVLVSISKARGVELEILQQILYFVAIAVKGHEAVSLLVRHGFIEDQIALALYQLESRDDDVALWKMARWDTRSRLLYLSAQLKPLLYLQPLLPHSPGLAECGQAMMAHIPPETVERLESVVSTMVGQRSGDTHCDVVAGLGLVLECL